jgi:hypothetical protein
MAAVDVFDALNSELEAFPFSLPVRTKQDLVDLEIFLCGASGNKDRLVDFLVAVAGVS